MPEAENVKVAVRVRPFNKRELGRHAECIIQMNGKSTALIHPDNPDKRNQFTFDHSYWSFDGSKEEKDGYLSPDLSHANGSKFADQQRVFDDLGQGILKNAWEGYNSSLFAYGQTGSGKSWSIIGYGRNKGIVPLFCEAIFKEITQKHAENGEYEVRLSMLEIYNEVVRDLLNSKADKKKGLKVREQPNKGFFADGLTQALVTSYENIEQKMNEGTISRTVAATNMNETSSRAHTIVTITFVQKHKNDAGQEMVKTATINLVDLAGSERVQSTGATGERLKEGAAINLSLSSLGNCIHTLAEMSSGKPGLKVPYRDSVLTKLLMHALGGNSKTVMVAALSPADINYEETLSTLRYADRAKQIKTVAVVNEDPTEKMIRNLKEENLRLKNMLDTGAIPAGLDGMSDADKLSLKKKYEEDLKATMKENERQLQEMRKTFEEKLRMADVDGNLAMIEKEKLTKTHLYNLNMDSQLTGKIVHILNPGKTTIGNHKGTPSTVVINGPSIQQQHAIINLQENGEMFLEPAVPDARVLHNGDNVTRKMALHHNDRIMFGPTQIYVLCVPSEKSSKACNDITFDFAVEEIAKKAGLSVGGQHDPETLVLQDDLLDVLPAVQEANSISSDLDKRVKFEITLVSPEMLGKITGKTEVCVKMKNLESGQEFVWPKEKFLNRLYLMKEMYSKYEYDDDDDDDWDENSDPDIDHDPFAESPDTEVHIGSAQVFLQPLAYRVEMKDQLPVTDYKSNEVGLVNVEVVPCDSKGKEFSEQDDQFVDDPEELVGKELHFIFKLISARGLPNRFTDIYCKYTLFGNDPECTAVVADTTNPDFKYSKMYSFKPVVKELLNELQDGMVTLQIWGKQKNRKSAALFAKGKTTKELLTEDRDILARSAMPGGSFHMNGRLIDPEKQSVVVELLLMKKQQARLQQRVDCLKKLIERAEYLNRRTIPTALLKDVFNAASPETAEKIMILLEDLEDDDSEYKMKNPNSAMCILI